MFGLELAMFFLVFQQYGLTISDDRMGQPLLISLPSAKDKRQGRTLPHRLVPEFCVVTGVDEAMRTDFRFKKEVEVHTKFNPQERSKKLSDFVKKFNRYFIHEIKIILVYNSQFSFV